MGMSRFELPGRACSEVNTCSGTSKLRQRLHAVQADDREMDRGVEAEHSEAGRQNRRHGLAWVATNLKGSHDLVPV